MNKKGASSWLIGIIIGVVVFAAVIYFFIGTQATCNLLDNGLTKPATNAPTNGAVFTWYYNIQKHYLDPSFQYLFGNTFKDSLKFIVGYRGVCASITSFLDNFLLALLALIWIALGKFFIWLLIKLFRLGAKGFNYWASVGRSTYMSTIKVIGLLVIYPTLMQVAVVNRVIEVLTFYYFTNWLIYSLILAIYVGWLPEIIQGLIKYREYQKAQKAIFLMKAGTTKIQTAGKSN